MCFVLHTSSPCSLLQHRHAFLVPKFTASFSIDFGLDTRTVCHSVCTNFCCPEYCQRVDVRLSLPVCLRNSLGQRNVLSNLCFLDAHKATPLHLSLNLNGSLNITRVLLGLSISSNYSTLPIVVQQPVRKTAKSVKTLSSDLMANTGKSTELVCCGNCILITMHCSCLLL